jgi:large subunit ribosomal protein L4
MANVKVYNMEGKEVGSMELNDTVFGVEVNEHLMHLAVVSQLANKRQGTQSAKTRAEVSGGGRKPWKQKGTGHARQGSTRSPQWTGGGVVFAPKPKEYTVKMNKKEKAAAIKSALTAKVSEQKFIVIDDLSVPEIKTKRIVGLLDSFKLNKALVVTTEKNEMVSASAKNIPDVRTTESGSINVFDIMKYDTVVIAKDAVKKIEEVYA